MRDFFTGLAIGIVAGIALGLAVYHHFLRWEPLQTTTATFKPGTVQADGSADLTRIPTAPQDAGPAPHVLPRGAKEVARGHIVVKPRPKAGPYVPAGPHGPDHVSQPGSMACSCEPVVIDVSQYLGPDGAGIIASSPDGEVDITRSTFTPMLEQRPPPARFVHVTAEPGRDAYTAAIGRRWGRVGLSIGGAKQPGQEARPLLGVEWSW